MNEFDATHAWLEADGKQFFGFGGHFYLPKDNSKKIEKRCYKILSAD